MGMLQLIFMISFTVLHMPTTCSLASMLNISAASCSSSLSNISDDTSPSNVNQQRSLQALIWLIWPTVLIAGEVHATVHDIYEAWLAHRFLANKQFRRVVRSKDLHSSFLSKLCEILLKVLSLKIFCLVMYIWIYKYIWIESYESYVEVTAVVLLAGWMTSLTLFGAVSKNYSVFVLVIQKIVVKDIPIFMLIFGFTIVGFSFSMHMLRLSACLDETIDFDSTFFSVLSSAFGIGEFLEVTVTNAKCDDSNEIYSFEFVYFLYVCATMIILLNILIAMMTNRYKKAKRRAKNIWMFNMLSTVRKFESYRCFVYLMKKWDVNVFGINEDNNNKHLLDCVMPKRANADRNREADERISDKIDRLLVFNNKSNRYYLLVEVPVDKNVIRGHLSLR